MDRSTSVTVRHRIAVTAVFAGNGALMGALFARFPAIQERLGLSEGELGLALLFGPIGLVSSVLIAGAAVVRHGSRVVSAVGAAGYAGLLFLPGVAGNLGGLALAMLALGASSGILDVAMNAQGLSVEKRYPRRIFASLHAGFSIGVLAGAGGAALAAAAGVGVVAHLVASAVVVGAVMAASIATFVADEPEARSGPSFARPSRALAALGVVAFCTLLAEGALADWSAVYLVQVHDTGPATAALGLAVFSVAMAVGRLSGDSVAERIGSRWLARGGLMLATAGFAVAAVAPAAGTAFVAFVVLGLGLAAVYPMCMRAAAGRGDMPAPTAIAAITTTGYVGFLAGPPAVGFVAEASSLRASMVVIAGLCLVAAGLARAVTD